MTRPLAVIRAVAFIDGQNLFAAARDAFGVRAPSFDVVALSHAVAASQGWEVRGGGTAFRYGEAARVKSERHLEALGASVTAVLHGIDHS